MCEPKAWQVFVIANTKFDSVYSVQTGEIKVFHGRAQSRGPMVTQWHHYGMFGKPLVCEGVHTTEVTLEQQLLLLWRISNDNKYVHFTVPFLLWKPTEVLPNKQSQIKKQPVHQSWWLTILQPSIPTRTWQEDSEFVMRPSIENAAIIYANILLIPLLSRICLLLQSV